MRGSRPIGASVTELYRVRGFSRATVRPEVSVLPDHSTEGQRYRPVAVRLVVAEGVQTTVANVAIDGAAEVPESQSVRSWGSPPAGPSTVRSSTPIATPSSGSITTRGSARSWSTPADGRGQGARLDIRWTIREGPRTLVDHVLVTGNERAGEDLIRREMVLQPGKPLGDDAMLESQRRLAALGLFRRVRIVDIPHQTSPNRDVLVEVEESPSTTLDYGGGVEAGRRVRLADDAAAAPRSVSRSRRAASSRSPAAISGERTGRSACSPASACVRSDPAVDPNAPRTRRLRLQRISRGRDVPGAAADRFARRSAADNVLRAGHPIELQFQPAWRARGVRAASRPGRDGQRALRHRSHAAVRREDRA